MRKNYTTIGKKGLLTFFVTALFCVSMMAQDYDLVVTVPYDEDDETTWLLMESSVTDTSLTDNSTWGDSDPDKVEYLSAGDWIEYQLITFTSGTYGAVITAGSKRAAASLNVSVYETIGGEYDSEAGTTLNVYNNSWTTGPEYTFPIELTAGVYYTMRVTIVGAGSNLFAMRVDELDGSLDASLSEIVVNDDTTLLDFDSETYEYNVILGAGEWVNTLTATATDTAGATVDIPTDFTSDDTAESYEITVTSEAGITQIYTVNVTAPVELTDGLTWNRDDTNLDSYIYANNGVGVSSSGEVIYNFGDGDYLDYYVYAKYDAQFKLIITYSNENEDSEDYFNVSTLDIDDSTWTASDIYNFQVVPTLDDDGDPSADADYSQEVTTYFWVSEDAPVLLRIYGVTESGGSTANIYGYELEEVYGDYDATLSDLTVDGSTISGFESTTSSYSVALGLDATSAVVAAEANSTTAVVTGEGTVEFSGDVTSDTINVESEIGFAIDYVVNFYSPTKISFDTTDSVSLGLSSDLFYNGGAVVTDLKINYMANEEYVEYYIYSETDVDLHLVISATNGNADTVYGKLNVSTYHSGDEWTYDDANSYFIPRYEADNWSDSVATDVKYELSLAANDPVLLRIYAVSDGISSAADIFGLTLVNGASNYTAIETTEAGELNVYGTTGSIKVICDEDYVGGSVHIYNTLGRLVASEMVTSTSNIYSVDQNGLYIVKVVSPTNTVKTVKCIVK
jgi:hypothetical protein